MVGSPIVVAALLKAGVRLPALPFCDPAQPRFCCHDWRACCGERAGCCWLAAGGRCCVRAAGAAGLRRTPLCLRRWARGLFCLFATGCCCCGARAEPFSGRGAGPVERAAAAAGRALSPAGREVVAVQHAAEIVGGALLPVARVVEVAPRAAAPSPLFAHGRGTRSRKATELKWRRFL